MTGNAQVALILIPLVLAAAAWIVWRNVIQPRQLLARQTVSTVGDVAYPGGTLDPAAHYTGPDLSHLGPPPEWGNKSPGCPPHPRPIADDTPGYEIDIPTGVDLPLGTGDKFDSEAFNHGPLPGKTRINLTLDALYSEPDAQVLAVPEVNPLGRYPARVTIYFQRVGDNWSASGKYEPYRWYYTAEDFYLKPGLNEISVPLDSGWTGTQTSSIENNPQGFKDAIDNCLAVGWGLGGNEIGRIHGARATKPVTIRVLKFEVV